MTTGVNARIQLFVYFPHHEISKPTFGKRSKMQATSLQISRWHCRLVDRQDVSADAACNVRDLAKRAFVENLYRDLTKRSCQEISYGDLVEEVLPRDLL